MRFLRSCLSSRELSTPHALSHAYLLHSTGLDRFSQGRIAPLPCLFPSYHVYGSAANALLRLSNASFVSCAAAVGGEKTAASAPNVTLDGKGRCKDAKTRSEQERTTTSGSAPRENSGQGDNRPVSAPQSTQYENKTMGVDKLATELTRRARVPSREASASLYFAFDHCFSVRGQGTILTGTMLTGEVRVSGFPRDVMSCHDVEALCIFLFLSLIDPKGVAVDF